MNLTNQSSAGSDFSVTSAHLRSDFTFKLDKTVISQIPSMQTFLCEKTHLQSWILSVFISLCFITVKCSEFAQHIPPVCIQRYNQVFVNFTLLVSHLMKYQLYNLLSAFIEYIQYKLFHLELAGIFYHGILSAE